MCKKIKQFFFGISLKHLLFKPQWGAGEMLEAVYARQDQVDVGETVEKDDARLRKKIYSK